MTHSMMNGAKIMTMNEESPHSIQEGSGGNPKPYTAINGHQMIQQTPGQWWDAICVDDCKACATGEPLPDW
jgi:hypothetical protein